MIRPLSLLLSFLATQSCVQAYSTLLPQRSSYFVGRSVQGASPVNPAIHRGNHGTSATLTMKKGKANVPPQMRSQYARAQEMESYRKQMIESQRVGKDGLPVFNLYVRTGLKNLFAFVALRGEQQFYGTFTASKWRVIPEPQHEVSKTFARVL